MGYAHPRNVKLRRQAERRLIAMGLKYAQAARAAENPHATDEVMARFAQVEDRIRRAADVYVANDPDARKTAANWLHPDRLETDLLNPTQI